MGSSGQAGEEVTARVYEYGYDSYDEEQTVRLSWKIFDSSLPAKSTRTTSLLLPTITKRGTHLHCFALHFTPLDPTSPHRSPRLKLAQPCAAALTMRGL